MILMSMMMNPCLGYTDSDAKNIFKGKLNSKMDTIIALLSKIRTFSIFKKGRVGLRSPLRSPLSASVSVAEYASISLNMSKYL